MPLSEPSTASPSTEHTSKLNGRGGLCTIGSLRDMGLDDLLVAGLATTGGCGTAGETERNTSES